MENSEQVGPIEEAANEFKLPRNPRFPDRDPNAFMDAYIQAAYADNPTEAEKFRKQVVETPALQGFFINGPSTLSSYTSEAISNPGRAGAPKIDLSPNPGSGK